jgi:hypothetical protein
LRIRSHRCAVCDTARQQALCVDLVILGECCLNGLCAPLRQRQVGFQRPLLVAVADDEDAQALVGGQQFADLVQLQPGVGLDL